MNETRHRFDYDVAILGGGSAGYAAARTAATAGLRTVVIEGGAEVGGLCILRGCMPTKALLYAAEVLHHAGQAEPWGVLVEKVGFDFAQVMARKDTLIEEFAEDRRDELASGQFKFIRAHATFLDPHTVALSNAGPLTAAHFVITTGSTVAPPPLPQLREVGYLTSDDVMKLAQLPKSLIVLGGGGVAVEMAQFFARFGVAVTLLQRSAHLLREFDTDAAMEIENVFRRDGIEVFTNTKLTDARRDGPRKTISFEHHGQPTTVSAEEILFALGRVPNTAWLDLDQAGVATDRGRIVANEFMQTSAPHIYTAGDCTGPHDIAHLAVRQGETAAHNIAHSSAPRGMDDRLLLGVIFTEPQVAFVGLTEKTAKTRGVPYLTARHPFSDHGKSLIMEARKGYVKLLADPQSGEILGGACVGPVGGELIHEIVAALSKRMTVHELAALPHYHPTLAEIWTYAAEALAERIPAPVGLHPIGKLRYSAQGYFLMKTLFTAEAISKGARSGTIHSPDQLLKVTLGNPLEKGLEKRGPNPELLFAGAYSACYHGALSNAARKLGTPVEDSTVRALVSLIEDDQGGYRLAVELHAQLPGIDRAQAQRIMDEAHKTCPYSKALRGDTAVKLVVD